MIRIFKKSWRRSKRTVCAALSLVLILSLMAAPAGAAGFDSGTFSFRVFTNRFLSSSVSNLINSSYPVNDPNFQQSLNVNYSLGDTVTLNPDYIDISPGVPLEGSVGVYFSFYFVVPLSSNTVDIDFDRASAYVRYVDGNGESTELSSISLSRFSPLPVDERTVSSGVLIKGRTAPYSSIAPLQLFRVGFDYVSFSYTSSDHSSPLIFVPSVYYLSSDSFTLDSLENIADGIAAQSEIMSAFYGDIMSLLNDLYSRLGDIQAVEELTNTYFAQLIPLVNSINTNTANIYSLLQTQFQLLRTLIATESDDIQAAIAQQTEDLKAYFDTVFSGAVGDMPEKSDDLETSVGDLSNAESQYQSTATQRFDDITADFSGFSGGVLAGITLASTLFTRVWDALGEYNIVYFFPLLLGLCLVIIGRLSRGSGGQSSSAKHRGDSSA